MMCRIFARAFQVPRGHVIEAGYPRNDYILGEEIENIFSNEEGEAFNQIHQWKSLGKKVVMYMPTFRDSEGFFSSVMDMENFNGFLSQNDILFLTKLHPKSKLKKEFGQKDFKNILNLNADMDPYIFLKQVDILVTDYSSVYSDYMLLDRPVIAFWYDYKEYTENTRDSYFDFDEYMPEIRAKNFEELKKALECVLLEDICKEARSRSREKMFSSMQGDACSKLAGKINKILIGDL